MIPSACRQWWGRIQGVLPVGAELFATNKIQGKGEPLPSVVDCVNPVVTQAALMSHKTKPKVRKARKGTEMGGRRT